MVAALSNAALDDGSSVAKASGSESEVVAQVREVQAADVAQLDVLEVAPAALVRVQIGGVAGELLQADAPGAAPGPEVLDRLAAMDRRAIPEHQELAGDVAEQVPEDAHDVRALVRPLLHAHQQPAIRGDAADDRQVIAAQRQAEDRRLAARGVGPDGAGQQVEAGLVDPDDGPSFPVGPRFRAGQRSVRTRLAVQTSPRKPNASAPCASRCGSCARCSVVSFGGEPGARRRLSASAPPSRARRIHWLTAPDVTPRASAMACWLQFCRFNAQARNRRPSRQSLGSCCAVVMPQTSAQPRPPLATDTEISNSDADGVVRRRRLSAAAVARRIPIGGRCTHGGLRGAGSHGTGSRSRAGQDVAATSCSGARYCVEMDETNVSASSNTPATSRVPMQESPPTREMFVRLERMSGRPLSRRGRRFAPPAA
jgi:hypothetical protein